MSRLHDALGLDELLEAAGTAIPGWGLTHPDCGDLRTLDDVLAASRTGSVQARDDVLFALARRASVDGGDDRRAAAVLCRLLVPGVIAKLGGLRLPASAWTVDQLAAGHLWVQCRTFRCDRRSKVAPMIVWNVRRAVLADLRVSDRGVDKTWANTILVADLQLEYLAEPVIRDEADPDVADLLQLSLSDELITWEQARLLVMLMRIAEDSAPKRVTRHGLLSAEVSRRVGDEAGIGASTVRAKVGSALSSLRDANSKVA